MRLVASLAMCAVACAPSLKAEPPLTLEPPTTTTTASATTTTTVPETTTTGPVTTTATSPPLLPEDVIALRTSTGVNVAVVDYTGTGFLVRTPCGDEVELTEGEPIHHVPVVIDPGHGGPIDTGAIGANGLVESQLNLDVAKVTERELLSRSIGVALTRTADYATLLGVRSAFADHLAADVLVSIHHNAPAPPPADLPGTEVFVQSDSDESRRLGQLVWEHVRGGLEVFGDVAWTAAEDVGVLRVLSTRGSDAYGMIRRPETVSVLAELAYLNNPSEARLMATPEYIEVAGRLVADAIEAYLTTDEEGSGWVDEPRVFNPSPGIGSDACVDPDLQ